MQISSLKLNNFRCFGPTTVQLRLRKTTALIGNNGSGKSAALLALLRLFGTTPTDRTLVRSDFHLPKGKDWDELTEAHLSIEARLDFPELKPGQTATGAAAYFKHMTVSGHGGRPYCRIRLEGTWKKSNLPEGDIEQTLIWVTSAAGVDPEQTVAVQGHDRSRIHVQYVPAVRDPVRQIRQVSGSLLHNLLQAVEWSQAVKEAVTESSEALRNAFDSEAGVQDIQQALESSWNELQSWTEHGTVSVRPVAKRFEDVLKQVETVFSPAPAGKEEGIERLSDGQRSLFYLTLVTSVFDVQNTLRKQGSKNLSREKLDPPVLTLFAVEEPENHVAPHYLARIMATLRRISTSRYGQVVLSSHSPAILARVEPEEVRHLRIDPASDVSTIQSITLPEEADDAYKFVREAVRAYPELYFARFVIFGEGDSEEIVLPRLAAANGVSVDPSFVSVVPLGGRHVNHFWRLLENLGIPYITLLDLDRERQGGGWGRIKYALAQLLEIGRPEVDVLTGSISRKDLEGMHDWEASDVASQATWIDHLATLGVFFSQPLDLDFMMLEAFPEAYHESVEPGAKGPRIPKDKDDYEEALEEVLKAVLKAAGGKGDTYTDSQKKAFFWYRYLFLGRSKPSSHISALSQIDEEQLSANAPEVLLALISQMKAALGMAEGEDDGF